MADKSKLSPVSPAPDMNSYMARDAMHTIMKAEEYKRDKNLMKQVKALASDVHRAIGAGGMKAGKGKSSATKNPSTTKGGVAGLKKAQAPQARKASKLSKVEK